MNTKEEKGLQKQNETVSAVIPQKRLVAIMAEKFNLSPEKLLPVLKDTCFKCATDEQMVALLVVANG